MPIDTAIVLGVVFVIVLIWRGPKTLPRWGQVLGRGTKAARKELDEIRSDIDKRDAPKD
jgi:Sec-independent protein translocase protein TatA